MRKRPLDFFGPDDYTGGDPADDVRSIAEAQAQWDERFASIPLWRRLVFDIMGF